MAYKAARETNSTISGVVVIETNYPYSPAIHLCFIDGIFASFL